MWNYSGKEDWDHAACEPGECKDNKHEGNF